jgi:hypothetical protein
MKKLICLIALAAISFSSVYAHGTTNKVKTSIQDTTKRKKTRPMRDTSKKKKDTTQVKHK